MNEQEKAKEWKPTHHLVLKAYEVKKRPKKDEPKRVLYYTIDEDVCELPGPPHGDKTRPNGKFYQRKSEFESGKMPEIVGTGYSEQHMTGLNFITWEVYSDKYASFEAQYHGDLKRLEQ